MINERSYKMKIKHCNIFKFIVVLVFIITVNAASAEQIKVDIKGGADYANIQDAVDNAENGDTILVSSGTYIENVDINKQLSIISESRNPDDTIVQAGEQDGYIFKVSANNVTISGFSIKGRGFDVEHVSIESSIYFYGGQNLTINNNKLSNNKVAIFILGANNNKIKNNRIFNNKVIGITIKDSNNNMLINNNVSNNGDQGIYLYNSHNNTLNSIIANSNQMFGIRFQGCTNNKLINSTTSFNKMDGIYLQSPSKNNILNNNIVKSNNRVGIHIFHSNNNTLINNTISSNNDYGINLKNSNYNFIYNNYINNTNNTGFEGTNIGNIWNITKTIDTNIVGGPYLGGNFWANQNDTGFSQTCKDSDNDGICDLAYELTEDVFDLMPVSRLGDIQESIITSTPTTTSEEKTNGFKAIYMIAAILAVAYLLKKFK